MKFWPYGLVAWILGPAVWIIAIIYYFSVFRNKVAEDIERIRCSNEYQEQVRELDEQFDLIDQNEYNRCAAAQKEYDEVLIPLYMREKAEWTQKRDYCLSETKRQLDEAQSKLDTIYLTTRLIPSDYHNIEALSYMYKYMSTSQFDIKETIDKYEQYKARVREQEYQSAMLRAQNEQAEAAWQARDLAEQQRDIAEKARHEQNLANLVHAGQLHETNKQLKNLNKR